MPVCAPSRTSGSSRCWGHCFISPLIIMAFLKQDHTSHHTPCPSAGAGVGQIRDWGGCICSFTCDPKERPKRICSNGSPPFVTSSIFHTVNLTSLFFLIACPLSVAVSSLHCFVYSSRRIITSGWVGRDLIQPLPWTETHPTRPDCPKPHPVWSWTLPGMRHPQLLWTTCSSTSQPSQWGVSSKYLL